MANGQMYTHYFQEEVKVWDDGYSLKDLQDFKENLSFLRQLKIDENTSIFCRQIVAYSTNKVSERKVVIKYKEIKRV